MFIIHHIEKGRFKAKNIVIMLPVVYAHTHTGERARMNIKRVKFNMNSQER